MGETPAARSMGATTGSAITPVPSRKLPAPKVMSMLRPKALPAPILNQSTIRPRAPAVINRMDRSMPLRMTRRSGRVVRTPSRAASRPTLRGVL